MLKKNDVIKLHIDSLSGDGSGVGRADGMAVFVPCTAAGDTVAARIVKVMPRFAYGIVEEVLTAGAGRIQPDCPVFPRCGGCSLRHLSYEAELEAKRQFVEDALRRLGGLNVPVLPTLHAGDTDRYRNKVQFPVGEDEKGLFVGLYAARSHRVIPAGDCLLQPGELNEIAKAACAILTAQKVHAYNEATGKGLLRHIFLRRSSVDGGVMLCLVINGRRLPDEAAFVSGITAQFPCIKTVVLNENRQKTNVILGPVCRTLTGSGHLEDVLCGVPVRLNPLSFFQINHAAATLLYEKAAEMAQLTGNETLLDLYCGAGTIGLSMAHRCKKLIGVEVIPEAVEDAKHNAAAMGYDHCTFIASDADGAAAKLREEGTVLDVAITDPPRKGCGDSVLQSLVAMVPRRIVMVSCNAATLARDVKYLAAHGYMPGPAQPVDLFPRTPHVECVMALTKAEGPTAAPAGGFAAIEETCCGTWE